MNTLSCITWFHIKQVEMKLQSFMDTIQVNCFILKQTNTTKWRANTYGKTGLCGVFVMLNSYLVACRTAATTKMSATKYKSSFVIHNPSLSFASSKFWIFWKFSSCCPRASSKRPIGDLFSPAPSILFSSLFFMLRRRNEA